jgi:hypothetical protein
MKKQPFSRYTISCCLAAALLAACGGSQAPIGAPGAMPQPPAIATRADRGKSWMLPEAKREDLLYISDAGNDTVTAYSYPRGRLVGTLGGFDFPYGQCVDKVGDVFITNTNASNILEYPHGSSSPTATIGDAGEHPAGCSVDPLNGDLAVNNTYTVSRGGAGFLNSQTALVM